jgi:UDP-N-acetylmuramyl tripeptide synthase
MKLIDSRRLRGPNLQLGGPAAVAEVALDTGEDPAVVVDAWRRELQRLADAVGLTGTERSVVRPYPGGVCFAVTAPIDVLYAATEVNEWAIASVAASLGGDALQETFEDACTRIAAEVAEETRPRLVALGTAAHARGVPFLWDDETVTLGMAGHSLSYPIDELPEPYEVPWATLGRIPVVLVTGTNGKTTSTRLVARMLFEAGRVVGNTSTDGIAVNGVVVEAGDWTGAEAARSLLRRPEIEVAVLETARGGILRRGLGVDRADAALLLNVSADHLGEFGVCDLHTMARAKAVVGQVVHPPGHVVLNADDPHVVALAPTFRAPVILFSLDAASAAVQAHRAAGGVAFFARAGALWRAAGADEVQLVRIADIPITFGGAAHYNIANALAATALAWSLRVSDGAIARALTTFTASDNPGRGQLVELAGGVRMLVDFGHNPVALDAVLELAHVLQRDPSRPARSLIVATTQAGDRDEQALGAQAAAIARAHPVRALVWETPHLLRGRPPGEVSEILARELRAGGVPEVEIATTEVEAVEHAIRSASPGDLVIVTPCIDRTGVAKVMVDAGRVQDG